MRILLGYFRTRKRLRPIILTVTAIVFALIAVKQFWMEPRRQERLNRRLEALSKAIHEFNWSCGFYPPGDNASQTTNTTAWNPAEIAFPLPWQPAKIAVPLPRPNNEFSDSKLIRFTGRSTGSLKIYDERKTITVNYGRERILIDVLDKDCVTNCVTGLGPAEFAARFSEDVPHVIEGLRTVKAEEDASWGEGERAVKIR